MGRVVRTSKGEPVLSYEEIERMRKEKNPLRVIAQKGCQERFLATNADITIFGGNRGGGKCMVYNTLVCTPFGFRPIGELKRGDIITGSDGGMQKVIYNCDNGIKDLYRVTFVDGASVLCSADHLWNIKQSNYCTKKRHIYNLPLDSQWTVMDTESIAEHIKKQVGKKHPHHLSVPLCKPVRFTKGTGRGFKPSIDPYVIGALIGDGCFTGYMIDKSMCSLESADKEIVDEFERAGVCACAAYENNDKKSITYIFRGEVVEHIKKLGMAGMCSSSKRIPKYYLYAPLGERYALVQGLMDTDGYVDERGHLSYTSVSKGLAEDVRFIIESLGGIATITKKKAGYKKEGIYTQCKDAYELYIRIPDGEKLFRLTRKKERCREYNGGISLHGRRIIKCEREGTGRVCCIRVTNPDSLYLVDDFIVTHNSYALLMEALKDVKNKDMNSIILRNEKPDLSGLIEKSYKLFSPFGKYNKSINDMTWNFDKGGKLNFSYFADSLADFKMRFQGKEYNYIGIDEITHISYEKFKYLITCNRNAFNIRNRFYGTCNPDPDSWVRRYIDWWIGEDGLPIPERDGVLRYCFMDGDDLSNVYWGDTPQEVYEQCKETIDKLWKEEYAMLGFDKVSMFVKSVTFIRGKLEENIALITSDPNYVANLAQQGEEQRARDLEGNWNFKAAGDDLIKMEDMERMFANTWQTQDGIRRASCDVAFDRGDNLVLIFWIGMHIQDIYVCRVNAKESANLVRMKLREWGVRETNFVYDLNGIGQAFRAYFPMSVGFNNMGSPIPATPAEKDSIKYMYTSLKSQCAYIMVNEFREGHISINPHLLDTRYSGNGYSNVPLRQILMKERKAIRDAENEKGFSIIKKEVMKKYVGHSPDFIEAILYRMYFNIKPKSGKPNFTFRYVNRQHR